jgi:hypothetical protein
MMLHLRCTLQQGDDEPAVHDDDVHFCQNLMGSYRIERKAIRLERKQELLERSPVGEVGDIIFTVQGPNIATTNYSHLSLFSSRCCSAKLPKKNYRHLVCNRYALVDVRLTSETHSLEATALTQQLRLKNSERGAAFFHVKEFSVFSVCRTFVERSCFSTHRDLIDSQALRCRSH